MIKRIRFLAFFILCLYLLLAARLVYLQIFKSSFYQKKAKSYRFRMHFIRPRRGEILDGKGRVLAKDEGAFSLMVIPRKFDPLIQLVYAFLGSKTIWEKLEKGEKRFPFFLSSLAPRQASRILRIFSKEEEKKYLKIKWEEDGIYLFVKRALFQKAKQRLERTAQILQVPLSKLEKRWKKILDFAKNFEKNYERKVYFRTLHTLFSPLNSLQIRKIELAGIQGLVVKPRRHRKYFYPQEWGHILGRVGYITPREYKKLKKEGKILYPKRVSTLKISPEKLEKLQKAYFLDEKIGRSGLEKAGDALLRGKKGIQWVEEDAKNRMVKILKEIPAQGGKDLVLHLDIQLQKRLFQSFEELERKIQKGVLKSLTGHAVGAAVAINPQTGGIYALLSYPPITSKNKNLFPFINRAISSAYPPGSIFKPISAIAFLETQEVHGKPWHITPETTVFCAHRYKGSRFFKCLGYHGPTHIIRALQKSCNIYFYKLGEEIGGEILHQWGAKLGLNEKTGVELRGEKIGNLPSPQWKKRRYGKKGTWYPGDSRNFAVGQGYLTVTPIGILRAITALFNGGKVLELHLFKATPPKIIRTLNLDAKHIEAIYRGMKAVAEPGGTAYGSGLEKFEVAVKTGSAQDGRGWNFAWIIGVSWGKKGKPAFPKMPSIAFVVMVEHTSGHGGHTAGPIAAKLLEAFFAGAK